MSGTPSTLDLLRRIDEAAPERRLQGTLADVPIAVHL